MCFIYHPEEVNIENVLLMLKTVSEPNPSQRQVLGIDWCWFNLDSLADADSVINNCFSTPRHKAP